MQAACWEEKIRFSSFILFPLPPRHRRHAPFEVPSFLPRGSFFLVAVFVLGFIKCSSDFSVILIRFSVTRESF